MAGKVFQLSDLANHRTEFIDEARSGLARLRDKDGTSLVMVPEARYAYLERVRELTALHLLVDHLIANRRQASVRELGDNAWLRVFDHDDLLELAAELGEALAAARGDEHTQVADGVVAAWRVTATQLTDPLRRSVLAGPLVGNELVEANRPASTEPGSP